MECRKRQEKLEKIFGLEQFQTVKSKFLNRFFFQLVTYLRFLQYIGTINKPIGTINMPIGTNN